MRPQPAAAPGPPGANPRAAVASRGRDEVAQPARRRGGGPPTFRRPCSRRDPPAAGRRRDPGPAAGTRRWTTSRGRPTRRPRRTAEVNSSRRVSREPAGSTGAAASGRQPLAALAAATGEDGAAGAGAHAQPEAVGLARRRLFGWKVRLLHGRLSRSTARIEAGRRSADVLWTERAGPRWCSTVRAQGTTVGGHGSHQRTQRRERGSNRPGTADRPNRRPRRVANATRPVTPPHLAAQRRLVSGGPSSASVPPHSSIRGDPQPAAAVGPRDATARASAYRLTHRCGQVWG